MNIGYGDPGKLYGRLPRLSLMKPACWHKEFTMELTDKASFRDAMAHVGAAVNIITTDGPAGRAGSPPARSAALPTRRRPCWSA